MPRETKTTLSGLPSLPVQVAGVATAEDEAPQPSWDKAGPATIPLTIGESLTYIIMEHTGTRQ